MKARAPAIVRGRETARRHMLATQTPATLLKKRAGVPSVLAETLISTKQPYPAFRLDGSPKVLFRNLACGASSPRVTRSLKSCGLRRSSV